MNEKIAQSQFNVRFTRDRRRDIDRKIERE